MTLFLVAAAMLAGTDPANVPAEAQPEKPKVVCKAVMVSGSRLARRKICMSEKQWVQETQENDRRTGGGTGRADKRQTN